MELDKKDLQIKSLKALCKKQEKKINNQRKEIINLNNRINKKDTKINNTLDYLVKCLQRDKDLDLDAILITIYNMLGNIKDLEEIING